jgi:hypothetical protein
MGKCSGKDVVAEIRRMIDTDLPELDVEAVGRVRIKYLSRVLVALKRG